MARCLSTKCLQVEVIHISWSAVIIFSTGVTVIVKNDYPKQMKYINFYWNVTIFDYYIQWLNGTKQGIVILFLLLS